MVDVAAAYLLCVLPLGRDDLPEPNAQLWRTSLPAPDSDADIFERIIRKWFKLPDRTKRFTPNQIAFIALGSGTPANVSKVGRAIFAFSKYFIQEGVSHGRRIVPRWDAVIRDFPSLLLTPSQKKSPSAATSETNPYDGMRRALDDECNEIRLETDRNPIRLAGGRRLPHLELSDDYVYEFQYWMDREDVVFPVPDGVPVLLLWPGTEARSGTLLSQEPRESCVVVAVDQPIPNPLLYREGRLRPKLEELVRAVQRAVATAQESRGLHDHLLSQRFRPTRIREHADIGSALDASQATATFRAATHDVTFLWGPPGTGKTHTLGEITAGFVRRGARVLAVATANVAVDQICLKSRDALIRHGLQEALGGGKVLRFGHARDPAVLNDRRFFPDKERAQELRKRLAELREILKRPGLSSLDKAGLNLEIKNLGKDLRDLTKTFLNAAKVVFTTVTQTCLDGTFDAVAPFDAVVIDEASMLSIPHLVAAARRAGSQLVVGGDFRQLGPIALAKTERADRWLHRDVFQLLDISTKNPPTHPALVMLTTQRRMHPAISECINAVFYSNLLENAAPAEVVASCNLQPLPGRGALFVEVTPGDDCAVEQTSGGSRCNKGTARRAVEIAAWLARQDGSLQIGIVTPYRAQVRLMQGILKHQATNVKERIHVGTVHTFQGSEKGAIIWDLVETRHHPIGRLYRGDQGNRLANVAITRAQGKMVFLGDPKAFTEAHAADAVQQLRRILQGLGANRVPWSEIAKQMAAGA